VARRRSGRSPGIAGSAVRRADSTHQPDPNDLLARPVEQLHDDVAFVQIDPVQVRWPVYAIDFPQLLQLVVRPIDQKEAVLDLLPRDRLWKRRLLGRNRSLAGSLRLPRGLLLVQPVAVRVVTGTVQATDSP